LRLPPRRRRRPEEEERGPGIGRGGLESSVLERGTDEKVVVAVAVEVRGDRGGAPGGSDLGAEGVADGLLVDLPELGGERRGDENC